MAKIEDCPGFETFGADVKAARKAKQLSRSALADMIHCDSRYLANIENEGTLPSLPVVIQLIKICGLPVERYVVHIDTTDIRAQTAELQKIGVNVNQIARRLNSMGPLYTQDVADIKGALAQIWQLQRYILSSQR